MWQFLDTTTAITTTTTTKTTSTRATEHRPKNPGQRTARTTAVPAASAENAFCCRQSLRRALTFARNTFRLLWKTRRGRGHTRGNARDSQRAKHLQPKHHSTTYHNKYWDGEHSREKCSSPADCFGSGQRQVWRVWQVRRTRKQGKTPLPCASEFPIEDRELKPADLELTPKLARIFREFSAVRGPPRGGG